MKKRFLSALLTLCMMMTMLPMSALAAEVPELDWKTVGGVNQYTLTEDTQVTDVIEANDGQYEIDLDTYELAVKGFNVAKDSTLEISADKDSKKGVYAIDGDTVDFTLGGFVSIGEYVIFKDTAVFGQPAESAAAFRARAVTSNVISGKYENGLTIDKGVEATLQDVEVIKGDIVVAEGAKVTVTGNVTVTDGQIKVEGELTLGANANVEGEIVGDGKVDVASNVTAYSLDVSGDGAVDVYKIGADTSEAFVKNIRSGSTTVTMSDDGKAKLAFFPDTDRSIDSFEVDGNSKTVEADNTYSIDNDAQMHNVKVAFSTGSGGGGGGGGGGGASGYSVNVASTTNGTVTVSPKNAAKGATVTVTVKPNEGYVLDTLEVTDKDGKKVDLTDKGDNKYTFVMPASAVTVKATFKVAPKTPFTDVADSAWYAEAVAYVFEKGMMNGTSDTRFSPEQTTTRGMIVTILYRLEGEPSVSASSFSDVAPGKYYSNAVAWAAANKVVTGYGNGKFGPDDTITREQMAAILYRYASLKSYDVTAAADLSAYSDASQIGVFAKPAMQWANAAGLITGKTSTTLAPKSSATRAEVATILMRFCENIAK